MNDKDGCSSRSADDASAEDRDERKPLSIEEITARRRELFNAFSAKSLEVVKEPDDAPKACKLAETALKALSDNEWESGPPTPSEDADLLRVVEPELIRAYAVD
jgi:hypothetical protein